VAGVRNESVRQKLEPVLGKFTQNILWMRPESAEMTKHALNSFLALSIAFMNEVSSLGERVGADAREVSRGLKSDVRIGPKAYLSPGGAFAGGTLARDIVSLEKIAKSLGDNLDVLPAVRAANEHHKLWAWRKLQSRLPHLKESRVAVFGLTYKPGTDTLRRSSSVELCRRLAEAGAQVVAWDPAVHQLPEDLASLIKLGESAAKTAEGADALVIATPWPEFKTYAWPSLLAAMKRPLVIDAGSFLREPLSAIPSLDYLSVGVPA
jgi:UDPglucose 6-dehydrogenase